MKKSIQCGMLILAILIAALLVLPAFIDLGAHKGRYLPLMKEALHRPVDVGEVRLQLIPSPSIRLSNLKIGDNPAFSTNPFFTAQQMRLKLKLLPLFKGELQATEFILERPVLHLHKRPDGTFNFADIARNKAARARTEARTEKTHRPKTQEALKLSELVPLRVHINQGTLTLGSKGRRPFTVEGIDLSLRDFSTERPFPYRAAVNVPGIEPISIEGFLSYREDRGILSLKENHLKAQNVDFAVSGAVDHLTTVPMMQLSLVNDRFEIKAILDAMSAMGVTPNELEAAGPLGLRVSITGPSNRLTSEIRGRFQDLKVHEKRALKGTFGGEVFLKLPLGNDAPFTRSLRGNGKLAGSDGELTNVDLIDKVQRITGMIGLSRDERRDATTFQTLDAEFTLAEGMVDFERIYLRNSVMEARGRGKMTLNRPRLNLTVETTLSRQASARAGGARATAFFKDDQDRIVVPLKITGPVQKPSVNLNGEKMIRKGIGRAIEEKAGTFFERLFRRR